MDSAELLADGFERIHQVVHQVLDDIPAAHLTARVDPEANTIAWLIWHLARVQDDHVAHVAERPQVWTSEGWAERFGLAVPTADIGYGNNADQVASVVADASLLRDYFDAVHRATVDFLPTVSPDDLDRVVDRRWDPPVTLGVRLVSVLSDDLQHAGQAALLKGILARS